MSLSNDYFNSQVVYSAINSSPNPNSLVTANISIGNIAPKYKVIIIDENSGIQLFNGDLESYELNAFSSNGLTIKANGLFQTTYYNNTPYILQLGASPTISTIPYEPVFFPALQDAFKQATKDANQIDTKLEGLQEEPKEIKLDIIQEDRSW